MENKWHKKSEMNSFRFLILYIYKNLFVSAKGRGGNPNEHTDPIASAIVKYNYQVNCVLYSSFII